MKVNFSPFTNKKPQQKPQNPLAIAETFLNKVIASFLQNNKYMPQRVMSPLCYYILYTGIQFL